MNEFAFMEEAVDEICHSMVHEPERWHIGTYTVTDAKTGIAYWTGATGRSITCTWSGRTSNVVFSSAQGERIYDAYQELRAKHASAAQQRVLDRMQKKPKRESLLDRFLSLFVKEEND